MRFDCINMHVSYMTCHLYSYMLHMRFYPWYAATFHSTLHTLHFTLYTPHSTLSTPHCRLVTRETTLQTGTGNRGNMYMFCRKVRDYDCISCSVSTSSPLTARHPDRPATQWSSVGPGPLSLRMGPALELSALISKTESCWSDYRIYMYLQLHFITCIYMHIYIVFIYVIYIYTLYLIIIINSLS